MSIVTVVILAPGELCRGLAAYAEQSRGAYSDNTLRAIRSDTAIFAEWFGETGQSCDPPAAISLMQRRHAAC